MLLRTRFVATLTLLLGIAAASLLSAAVAPPPIYVDTNGVAISGYDVISYFEGREPLKGKAQWKAFFRGAEFHFATKQNRDRFQEEPEKFVPQFGGYCAFGMGHGKVMKCDPRRFSLKDGKLFLFSSAELRDNWEAGHTQLIASAIRYWRDLFRN